MPRQQLHEYESDRDYESYEIKALNGFVKKAWYIVRIYYFIPTETFEEEIVSPYFANKGSARRYAELHNIPLNKEMSVYENKINNNMKKKKITETYLRNLIRESIKKNLQETMDEDWKRGYKAAEMSEDFFEYNSALEHAEDLLHDLEDIYRDSDFSRYSSEIPNYNPDNNMRKTIKKFGEQVLQIYKYIKRKREQRDNLENLWQNQFEKETGTKVKDAEINGDAETSFNGGKYKIDNINAQRYNPDTDDYEDIG